MVRTEFNKRKIGPEILEWITGPGKEVFKGFLAALAQKYSSSVGKEQQKVLQTTKPRVLTTEVDLDAEPALPFDGAKRTKHLKQGKVRVEYRLDEDELYVNGKKVVRWLSKEQLSGEVIEGTILQLEADKNDPLNATLADWLCENQTFVPKKWQGRVWYFWGSEWSGSGSNRYVCCLIWCVTFWQRLYSGLGSDWDDRGPSASLETTTSRTF
jgi:hypothetical protein